MMRVWSHRTAWVVVLLLLTMCAVSVFATGSGEEAVSEGPAVARYAVPGSAPDDQDVIVDAINAKMAEDGVSVQLEVESIAWDVWDSKTNVMLVGGEPIELIQIMEDGRSFKTYQSEGALLPITDLIDEYGDNLRSVVPDSAWSAASVNNEIYTIPAIWADHPNGKWWITVRSDLLEATGMDTPTTLDELIAAGEAIQAEFEDRYGQTVYSWYHSVDLRLDSLNMAMDSWPFWVDTGAQAFIVYQDDASVAAYPLSPEFEQLSRMNRRLYEAGLIHPDVLTVPRDNISSWRSNGEFVYSFMTHVMQDLERMRARYPETELEMFRLNPDNKPILGYKEFYNSNGVPYTAENPEAAIQFMNWMWAEEDNHDLVLNGIEGVHFRRLDENRIETLVAADANVGSGISFWMAGLKQWREYNAATPDRIIEIQTGQRDADTTVIPSVAMGFDFDPQPVQSSFVNVVDVIKSDFTPIALGVVEYDDAIGAARAKLESAGIDEVVEEFRRQFEVWSENR